MKFTFLIPVYLARRKMEGWKDGDVVYDHPTPLDEKGTLVRTLESLEILKNESFTVVLVVSTVSPEIDDGVNKWLKNRLDEAKYLPKDLHIFSQQNLLNIKAYLGYELSKKYDEFLSLKGYSQNKNGGLLAGISLNSDVIVWLDDDELIRDRFFVSKLKEGFSKKIKREKIRLITGACPEGETGSYIRIRKKLPWMVYWDKIKKQNEAFNRIIGTEPRWKISPFAHGGLSAIHSEVFLKVPYDHNIRRGEDMDYNMNARMFGYTFFLDNTLEIRHCPLPRTHPSWRSVREDMLRYLWQRDKIRYQKISKDLKKIKAEDFDPYPGHFLKNNLEDLVYHSQQILATEYLIDGKINDAKEALENIKLCFDWTSMRENAPNAFEEYMRMKKLWLGLVNQIKKSNLNFCIKLKL